MELDLAAILMLEVIEDLNPWKVKKAGISYTTLVSHVTPTDIMCL